MNHPIDLLAPYVDGTLEPSERAVLDAHLRSCSRCREEVAAAGAARQALRELPTPEAPDIEAGFTAERLPELTTPPRAPWSKLAPLIAAAAVVALVAVVVPRLGGSADDAGRAADGLAEGGAGVRPELRLQIETIDYDEETLGEAASAFAARATDPAAGSGGAVSEDAASQPAAASEAPEAQYAGARRTDRAVACLERAFPGYPGELVQVKRAEFQGTPAFIGYVLESPGGDAPPETLSVWVADAGDCSILSLISARL